jgi:virulence-associated protein VapD
MANLFVPNTIKLIYSCVRKMRHLMLTDFEDVSSYLNQLKLKIIWINRHIELRFLNSNGIWVANIWCCDKYNMTLLCYIKCTIYTAWSCMMANLFVPNTIKLIYSCVRKMRHLMLTDFEDVSSYHGKIFCSKFWRCFILNK